jgi:integrase
MSPRPHLPVGTAGNMTCIPVDPTADGKPRWRASVRYRDRDGVTRKVVKFDETKGRAEKALKIALAERQTALGVGITSATRIEKLADVWLEEILESDRAVSTKEQYEDAVKRYVKPHMGQLRISEATTAACDRALGVIVAKHGNSSAKQAKAALTGMFKLAVRHDAATVNPMRETRTITRSKRVARALTDEERVDITDKLRADTDLGRRARELDLPDLVEFMLATGCRIGESLAVRYADVDFAARTIDINATIVRVRGKGLQRLPPKTQASRRKLVLPEFAVLMLQRRQHEVRFASPEGVVFPSPFAKTLRDPHNTAGDLREIREGLGYEWLTSHVFRKTVATRLDDAGVSNRQVADQLGHARPSMTTDTYMARKVVNPDAARILDR